MKKKVIIVILLLVAGLACCCYIAMEHDTGNGQLLPDISEFTSEKTGISEDTHGAEEATKPREIDVDGQSGTEMPTNQFTETEGSTDVIVTTEPITSEPETSETEVPQPTEPQSSITEAVTTGPIIDQMPPAIRG